MNPDRWHRIQQVLDQSLALPLEERETFLAEVGTGDPDLAKEVRSLLAQEEHHSFLEKPAAEYLALAEVPNDEIIGPYRIIHEIGRGGMGLVYEAEQQEPVRRTVALKVIKSGMDTDQVLARFETERQALALMSHPTIARVLDAGTTSDGRPYFSMEHVVGEPITVHCDRQRLTVRDRLELFVRVCNGIHYAHQKGIIHRDIKPSNVLVTIEDGVPVPKIIDFGVAKATAKGLITSNTLTEVGQLVGTPAYMSPEQAQLTDPDIDTRSDVYSLGALLFELLIGVAPLEEHDKEKTPFDEVLRTIREQDRPTLTSRLGNLDGVSANDIAHHRQSDSVSLGRELRGDLDWIVSKALSRERERRYGAASELAADVSRYLRSEPIVAGPLGASYRVRKFVHRHRVGVISGGLVAVAMVLAIVGTTVGMVRATRAERQSSKDAATAQAINRFLLETLAAANPESGLGKDVTVIEALDKGMETIGESFADQPEIEAAVRTTVGNTYRIIGRFDEAETQLRAALAIRERELGPDHLDLAESLTQLGGLHQEKRDYAAAEPMFRKALAMRRKLVGNMNPGTAQILNNLAISLMQQGQNEEAEKLLREALEIDREFFGNNHVQVAIMLHSLGGVLKRQRRYDEADPLYQEALAIVRRQFPGNHPAIAHATSGLADLLRLEGKCEEATPYFLESIEVFRSALGPGHWRGAEVSRGYGRCLTSLEKFAEAERQLLQAYSVMQTSLGDDSPVTQITHQDLAALYEAWGKPEQAAEYR